MGNVTKAKAVLSSGHHVLNIMLRKKYTTDFGGISNTVVNSELIAHMVGSTNEAAVGTLMDAIATPTCTANLLDITVNYGTEIVSDVTSITADPTDVKHAKVHIAIDDVTGDPEVIVFTKTTGEYGAMTAGKTFGADIKEYSLAAGGTALVEINDFIDKD